MRNQAATSRFRSKSFLITMAVIFMILLGIVYTVSFIYAATPSQKNSNGVIDTNDAANGLTNDNGPTAKSTTEDHQSSKNTEDYKNPNSNDDSLHIPTDFNKDVVHNNLKKDMEKIANVFDNEHFSDEEKDEISRKLEAELATGSKQHLPPNNNDNPATGKQDHQQQQHSDSEYDNHNANILDRAHAAPISVGIVDEHNDVLDFWLRAAKNSTFYYWFQTAN